MTVLITPYTDWRCPNCGLTTQTPASVPNRYHPCPRARGVMAPLVRAGVKAKVEVRGREDYVGTDRVTTDNTGRPVMSVVTTRDNGQDTAVFAPVATVTAQINSSRKAKGT